nr:MAG TPA: hypothetical protein [Caudoviricetes sp.]
MTAKANYCLPLCHRWHRRKAEVFQKMLPGVRENDSLTER